MLSDNAKTMVKILQDAVLEDPNTQINVALLHALQRNLKVSDEEMDEITRMFLASASHNLQKQASRFTKDNAQ